MKEKNKQYCDICKRVVKQKVIILDGQQICKNHLNKVNYFK